MIGQQDIDADGFAVRRVVSTGSWLGRDHQGRGAGKEMRAAVLHLAFAELGAERAETAAFADNPASIPSPRPSATSRTARPCRSAPGNRPASSATRSRETLGGPPPRRHRGHRPRPLPAPYSGVES